MKQIAKLKSLVLSTDLISELQHVVQFMSEYEETEQAYNEWRKDSGSIEKGIRWAKMQTKVLTGAIDSIPVATFY